MDLRHLRYFVTVAEELHFGRAAARLHMAQPPLSRQIQLLEAELGFQLFERSRRRVELTPAGSSLLSGARQVFDTLDAAVHDARSVGEGESGRLVIGYPSSLAYSGLTELLRAFRNRFPAVTLALRELPPGEQIDALKAGGLDVGFVRSSLDDPSLVSERVRQEALMVVLPDDHPLCARRLIPLAALAQEPFVLFPRARGPAYFDQLMALCRSAGFTPRITQEAPQLDIISMVAAGFGISIMPSSMRNFRRPGLAFRPIQGAPQVELLIVWRHQNLSPALHKFLDLVRLLGVDRRGPRAGSARRRARTRTPTSKTP
ncbi:MAG TPA: LysR substrate-binding domain-containing protein [Polyangiaceae bacterium]|jgi:DNA-binding transcriptional LysR family regulator|nr:LysR substrate-binding domain-containing protein [Polyangiaceae bacterium]